MKLHLGGLGDHAQSTINNKNVDPVGALTIEDLKKKKKTLDNARDCLCPKLC